MLLRSSCLQISRLDDPALGNEFTKLLSGNWRPVLSEVDSDGSKVDEIDGGSQRFANVGGAARRLGAHYLPWQRADWRGQRARWQSTFTLASCSRVTASPITTTLSAV